MRLIRFRYRTEDLGYVQYNEGVDIPPRSLTNEQVETALSSLLLSQPEQQQKTGGGRGRGFVPAKMEVRPACSGRSQIPPRVCFLGKDGETYKEYTIPEGWLGA